jgi:3-keto-disaccharide hydrolase
MTNPWLLLAFSRSDDSLPAKDPPSAKKQAIYVGENMVPVRTTALLFLLVGANLLRAGDNDAWAPLFNGKDFAGWDTWLGKPQGEKEPIGLNKDPKHVYTVVEADGKPAIRISGEIFGALTSQQEYENFHLKLEFKWGEKRWPPREKAVRDSGLLYHCVGPHGAAGSFWMRSQELQIQEHDCGDYWSVAGAMVDVEGVRKNGAVVYKKGGDKFTVPSKGNGPRIIKDPDNEKPTGQWNTIELIAVGGTSVHLINGKVVMILTNSRQSVDGKEAPLTKGKIQIQSEGAEVIYCNIAIRPVTAIPEKYLR